MHRFLDRYYKQAHRLMLPLLWLLFVCGLTLSTLHGTWNWALLVGLPTAIVPSLFIWRAPEVFATRALVASALMVFAALFIHQAAGMTELHFGIFVLLAFLLCYRDWKVILVAALVIAIHHLSFSYLQEWGYGVICFTKPGFGEVVLHALFVVIESAVLAYLAQVLYRDAVQAGELRTRVASMTGAGDGTIDLRLEADAPMSSAGKALQLMMVELRDAIIDVRDGTSTIAAASGKITNNNTALAERTAQQSGSLTATASSMGEITSAVKNSASHADHADALAKIAAEVAERGGAEVGKVVATMASINESSQKIVDIISVIDGIAFQTNILALNAAVEAARAGEQGRGFVVVASEVRSLASRSAEAAREIKSLIGASVERVEQGSALGDRAGHTMDEVVAAIQDLARLMGEISSASAEQSAGLGQVGEAVSQMDQATQQNAALVEESAAAAISLRNQAERLVQSVAVFKLARGATAEPKLAVEVTTPRATRSPVPPSKPYQGPERRSAARPGPGAAASTAAGEPGWASF